MVNIIIVLFLRNFAGESCYGKDRNGLATKGLVQLGFGASGAVARPKVCTNLQVLRSSQRQ